MKKFITLLKQILFFPFNFLQSRMSKSNTSINSIHSEEGGVIEENGIKIAVYKDADGKVTKLNPKCTHLGCVVGWDKEKKNWLCPCHGTEYDAMGKVIKGPAKKNLKEISRP